VFNAEDGRGLGLTATTAGELVDAIGKADAHKGGPILIECQIPNDDASPELISWGSKGRPCQGPPRRSILKGGLPLTHTPW
jgi:pyruvate decarboxylase